MKITLAILMLAVLGGFVFGLVATQRATDKHIAALQEQLTAYELRRDRLTQQQAMLEAAQLQADRDIAQAIEQERLLNEQRDAQAREAARKRAVAAAAKAEERRQELLRQQELERQRQLELLAKQRAQRTTRAS